MWVSHQHQQFWLVPLEHVVWAHYFKCGPDAEWHSCIPWCWQYSCWHSSGFLSLLQGCTVDMCWAFFMSFDNVSMTSWILTLGKQQASKTWSDIGSWVLLCPAEVPSTSMRCFSMLVLSCWIGSVSPVVPSSGTCLSSPHIDKTFYNFFQLFYFGFFSPNEKRAAVLLL